MSTTHAFATSPGATGEQRKFINPTLGWVGANVFGPDGKPTSVPVEPGGEVWLTPEEERMTAEAPRYAEDNPFVKEWECVVESDTYGEPIRSEIREGTLVLSQEPPRPVASSRYIPPAAEGQPAKPPEHIEGADVPPKQPPVQGQPSPNEVVGTPDAVKANDEALSRRKPTAEQRTTPSPVPVGADDNKGTSP